VDNIKKLIKTKTIDVDYQGKLNSYDKYYDDSMYGINAPIYISIGDADIYDIFPNKHRIKNHILRNTEQGIHINDIILYTNSTLNPFELNPDVLKRINKLNKDYVVYYFVIKTVKNSISRWAMNSMLTGVEKDFRESLSRYMYRTEHLNFYFDWVKCNNSYILMMKVDPKKRNVGVLVNRRRRN